MWVYIWTGLDQSWIAAACARSNNQLSFCGRTNTGPQLRDAESVVIDVTPSIPDPIVVKQTPSSDPFVDLLPSDSIHVNTQTPGPFAVCFVIITFQYNCSIIIGCNTGPSSTPNKFVRAIWRQILPLLFKYYKIFSRVTSNIAWNVSKIWSRLCIRNYNKATWRFG